MMSRWIPVLDRTRAFTLLLALCACRPNSSPEVAAAPSVKGTGSEVVRVALTFDDLPAHGPLIEGETLLDVHQTIVDTLANHKVEGAYGFINGAKVAEHAEGRSVLEMWRDAGQPLGNHTWAHSSIDDVGDRAFIGEVEKNDALLAELMGTDRSAERSRKRFRYPYLRQGRDRDLLDKVRAHLSEHQYQIAEVTVDFGDWAYNPAYARCVQAGRPKAVEALRKDFLRRALLALRWSQATADMLYRRPIAHIVLMHSGSFDALMLDDLLTAYENEGVQWVSVSKALEDPAYAEDIRVPLSYGGTLLEQRIERDETAHAPMPVQASALLDQMCR